MSWVRGIDACKAGWLDVSLESKRATPQFRVIREPAGLLFEDAEIIAIDIPIGLPARGNRRCDEEARARLKRRKSSVFPAPVRGVLGCHGYGEANRRHRELDGRGLSKQTFALFPRIREIDQILRRPGAKKLPVFEVHPELSFSFWNSGDPMRYPKRTGFGFLERYRLAESEFPGVVERIRTGSKPSEVADDDILDAIAALWTARRLARDVAVRMNPEDDRDACGLTMNIWA